jgi:hypothetical protein
VERNIRLVKERMRAIISVLPYNVPNSLMGYLADYAVMMINTFPRTTSNDNISPREHFTGRKTNYSRDFRVAFGEYAQVIIPNIVSNNVRQPRTEGAIALLPTGNAQSSVYFYILRTGKVVARDRFTVLPMPLEVIERMQDMAGQGTNDVLINVDIEQDSDDDDNIKVYMREDVEDLPPETEGLELITENPEVMVEDEIISEEGEQVNLNDDGEPAPRYSLRPNPTKREWFGQREFTAYRVSVKQALRNYPKEALHYIPLSRNYNKC